jgi:NAD(P)-dependent dehydrogenase (short-subunit alcohol dehydrogenase family)
MIGSFDGRTAFVTGAASGVGLALAHALAAEGAKVMLADIEQGALDAALRDLQDSGADARAVACDVSDRASVVRAAEETFAAFGKVHVVCNNAGVGIGGPVEAITETDWDWLIGVNFMGAVHGIQAFLPHIKAHGEGGRRQHRVHGRPGGTGWNCALQRHQGRRDLADGNPRRRARRH